MLKIAAHCVLIPGIHNVATPITDLTSVLYNIPTPYNPDRWVCALADTGLSTKYPTLVHNIIYGFPIGNPPPLNHTFLPPNLLTANIWPEVIDQELAEEVFTRQMSGPFT